jgi:hypothetical protein
LQIELQGLLAVLQEGEVPTRISPHDAVDVVPHLQRDPSFAALQGMGVLLQAAVTISCCGQVFVNDRLFLLSLR